MSQRNHSIMDRATLPPVSEDDIHTLLDAQASPDVLADLQARVERDPAALATWMAWRRQRDAMHGLHLEVLEEPIPASLLLPAQRTDHSIQAAAHWGRWGGMAAGILLAFGAGWLSHGPWEWIPPMGGTVLSQTPMGHEFIHQAALAHAVYAPEVRHPVEVAAAQQDHLVQWLSKRLGKPLKIPNLSAQGFELVGGRLLPGDQGARAQFMFQNASGERVTLYLGAVDARTTTTQGVSNQETAFRFSSDDAVPGFYWIDRGWGYALSGTLPRQGLLTLAEAVYPQL